ncbi:MAG: Uma2 family endonuclease [Verrucomicrobiaceae bacterium]|nr:Uma2 family endonuclease [Verrucomicrobiaceae bacterium]
MAVISYRPRYTVEDYLRWEGDWELWDGIPVAMSPSPGFFHQTIAGELFFQIKTVLESGSCPAGCRAVLDLDWQVDTTTVVRPDLMVICEKPAGERLEKRPELAAEILSSSTRQKDLIAKRELYAANGVPFYLILDSEDKSALLLSLGGDGTYRESLVEDPFEIHPGCVLRLEIAPLFV